MESTLHLRYGSLPSLPLPISSPLSAARIPNKPNFTPNHLSLSLTNSPYPRPLKHALSPIVCSINRSPTPPSMNDDDDNKIARGTVGASLVLACVLGIIGCGCKMNNAKAHASTLRNQPKKPVQVVQSPMFYPKGAKPALESLLNTTVYLSSRLGDTSKFKKWTSAKRPSASDVESIKKEAMQLLNSGKGDAVVKELREACKAVKGDPEPEFYIEMALVEVLICLGKYDEALKCNCLQNPAILSDGRVPLYKAIIYTMKDNKEVAYVHWKEFLRAVDDGGIPGPDSLG